LEETNVIEVQMTYDSDDDEERIIIDASFMAREEDYPEGLTFTVLPDFDFKMDLFSYEMVLMCVSLLLVLCCGGQRPYLLPTLLNTEFRFVRFKVVFRIDGRRLKSNSESSSRRVHTFEMTDAKAVVLFKIWIAMWKSCSKYLKDGIEGIIYNKVFEACETFPVLQKMYLRNREVLGPRNRHFTSGDVNDLVKKYFDAQLMMEMNLRIRPLNLRDWRCNLATLNVMKWRYTKGFGGTTSYERMMAEMSKRMDTSVEQLKKSYIYVDVATEFYDDDDDVGEEYKDCNAPPAELPLRFRPKFVATPSKEVTMQGYNAFGRKTKTVAEHVGYSVGTKRKREVISIFESSSGSSSDSSSDEGCAKTIKRYL